MYFRFYVFVLIIFAVNMSSPSGVRAVGIGQGKDASSMDDVSSSSLDDIDKLSTPAEKLIVEGDLLIDADRTEESIEKYKSALNALDAILVAEPNSLKALALKSRVLSRLANAHTELAKYEDAEREIKESIETADTALLINKNSWNAHFRRGVAITTYGVLNKSLARYSDASKDFHTALGEYDTAISLSPTGQNVFHHKAYCLAREAALQSYLSQNSQASANYLKALEIYDSSLAIDDADMVAANGKFWVLEDLARLDLSKGRIDQASVRIKQAEKLFLSVKQPFFTNTAFDSVPARLACLTADRLAKQEDYKSAKQCYVEAISDYEMALLKSSKSQTLLGGMAGAILDADRVSVLSCKDKSIEMAIANDSVSRHILEKVIAIYSQVLKSAPGCIWALDAKASATLDLATNVRVNSAAGKIAAAGVFQCCDEVLKQAPTDISALEIKTQLLTALGARSYTDSKLSEAIDFQRSALGLTRLVQSIAPELSWTFNSIAVIQNRIGRINVVRHENELAKTAFLASIDSADQYSVMRMEPSPAVLFYKVDDLVKLGDLAKIMGDNLKANVFYTQASDEDLRLLDIEPDSQYLHNQRAQALDKRAFCQSRLKSFGADAALKSYSSAVCEYLCVTKLSPDSDRAWLQCCATILHTMQLEYRLHLVQDAQKSYSHAVDAMQHVRKQYASKALLSECEHQIVKYKFLVNEKVGH